MNSIHRVSVKVEDYQELELTGPPISVAADRDGRSDVFDMWFETGGSRVTAVYVFGTGHPVRWNRHAWHFIGTVVTPSGRYRPPFLGAVVDVPHKV